MTSKVNAVLEEIRSKLEEQVAMHSDGSAGAGEAENVTDIEDAFDLYLTGIMDALLADFDISEDDAMDFMFSVFDALAEEGMLPPFPDETAPEDQVASWLGTAKSVGAAMHVQQAAEEAAED